VQVDSFIHGRGYVGLKVNDQVGQNFKTRKGVRQGDPLSSVLFNIVVDILAILINRAKNKGQILGAKNKGQISSMVASQSYNMQMIQYLSWIII
jgi:hypothetical protein